MKDFLSQKLDKKDEFLAWLKTQSRYAVTDTSIDLSEIPGVHLPPAHQWVGMPGYIAAANRLPHDAWWWVREQLRLKCGVYQDPTEYGVLVQLNSEWYSPAAQMALHISRDDPSMVAYTPDAEAGVRDKQVRTTLARWVRKHYPLFTDADLQRIDAMHAADISSELEILYGQENLEEVYTETRGDTGCMRHKKDHWGFPVHPSAVYDVPGVGIAVMRDLDGKFTARSLVYINPENPEDKRFVRVYGDVRLGARLRRNGFKLDSLIGVPLKRIPHPTYEGHFIMPYLDQPGGNGGPRGNGTRTWAALASMPEGFVPVTDEEYNRLLGELDSANLSYREYLLTPSTMSTTARVAAKVLDNDVFFFTCAISGETYDVRQGHSRTRVYINGQFADANTTHCLDWKVARAYYTDSSGLLGTRRAHVSPDTPTFTDATGSEFVDTAQAREARGYCQLSERYYPDDREWYNTDFVIGDGGLVLRKSDAVLYVVRNDVRDVHTWVHKSEVPKNAVRLHMYSGTKVFACPETTYETTRRGRKVLPGLHRVVQLFDGEWELERNVEEIQLDGLRVKYIVHKDDLEGDREALMDRLREHRAKAVVAAFQSDINFDREEAEKSAIRYIRSNALMYASLGLVDGEFRTAGTTHTATPAFMAMLDAPDDIYEGRPELFGAVKTYRFLRKRLWEVIDERFPPTEPQPEPQPEPQNETTDRERFVVAAA